MKELGLDVTLRVMEWRSSCSSSACRRTRTSTCTAWVGSTTSPDAYNGFVLWLANSATTTRTGRTPSTTLWSRRQSGRLAQRHGTRSTSSSRNILTGPSGQLLIMPIYWYTFSALVKNNVKASHSAHAPDRLLEGVHPQNGASQRAGRFGALPFIVPGNGSRIARC